MAISKPVTLGRVSSQVADHRHQRYHRRQQKPWCLANSSPHGRARIFTLPRRSLNVGRKNDQRHRRGGRRTIEDRTELAGSALIGWKVGATAQAAMDLLGMSEPFFGPMYERFYHQSGDEVPIVAAHGAGIETEFVVGLARDLPPRPTPYSNPQTCTDP